MRIRSSETFRSYETIFASAACIVLETGYRWLDEYIHLRLKEYQNETMERLYSRVRLVFEAKEAENIWLYIFVDRQGIYIPDNKTLEIITERLSTNRTDTSQSPLEMLAHFATTHVPVERTYANIAFTEGISVEGSIRRTGYAGSPFALAEEAVLQCSDGVVQPLVREGKTLLVAVYPTELRPHVEAKLEIERAQFRLILERDRNVVLKTMKLINSQGTFPDGFYGKVGEIIGGIAKGYQSS